MAFPHRRPAAAVLFLASALSFLAGCDSTSSGGDQPGPSGGSGTGPVTALVLDKTVSGTFQGMTYSPDSDTIPFVVDSGWTYRIVVANGSLVDECVVLRSNGLEYQVDHRSGYKGSQLLDTVILVSKHRDSLRLIVAGLSGSAYSTTLQRTAGIPKGALDPDAFENDDSKNSASRLYPDSAVQSRTFHGTDSTSKDQDYIAIPCVAGRTYVVRATGEGENAPSTDLLPPDGFWMMQSSSDNHRSGSRWWITDRFEVTVSGTYYYSLHSARSMAYEISVVSEAGVRSTIPADSYEDDDSFSVAKPIPTDSTWQKHNLRPLEQNRRDADWYSFHADSGRTYIIQTRNDRELTMHLVHPDTIDCYLRDSSLWVDWEWRRFKVFSTHRTGTFHLEVTGYDSTRYEISVVSRSGMIDGYLPDPWESDNVPAKAKSVATDSTVQRRTLHATRYMERSSDDVDWIRIDADSGFTYQLVLDGPGSSMISIYDENTTTPLPVEEGPTGGGYVTHHVYKLPSGRRGVFHVKVRASNDALSYKVAVSRKQGIDSTQVQDRFEPDNSFQAARTIVADGNWQQRTIHDLPRGGTDPDYLVFAVDSGKTYAFRTRDSGQYMSYAFRKADSSYHYLKDTAIGGVRAFLLAATENGKCYVGIDGKRGASYQVSLTVEDGLHAWGVLEAGEPDHGPASALVLPDGVTEVRRAIVASDTDWTGVRLRKGFQYRFMAKTSDNHYLNISFMDSTGKFLGGNSQVGYDGWSWMFEPDADGVYFIYVSLLRGLNELRLPYQIEFQALPIPKDPFEVDPDISHPARLAADSANALRAIRKGENDWMKIDVDAGRRLAVMFEHHGVANGGFQWIRFELCSADGTSLQSRILSKAGEGDTLFYTASQTGPVYVHVTGDETVTVPYSVGAELLPTDIDAENTWATAGTILDDGSWNRRLVAYQRWLKFPTKKGEAYRVDWLSEKETHVNLFDQDSMYQAGKSYCRSAILLARAKSDGWMYLLTEGRSEGFGVKVAVSRIPNDTDEPANDSLSGARPIRTDSTAIVGQLVPSERDCYSFNTVAGKRYTVRVVPENMAAIVFRDPATEPQWAGIGRASFVATESGASAFYLELPSDNLPGPYKVTLVESTDEP